MATTSSLDAAKRLMARLKILLAPIRGFQILSPKARVTDISAMFDVFMENRYGEGYDVSFSVPIPDDNGIIHLETGDFRVCKIVRATPLYNPWDRSIVDHYVVDEIETGCGPDRGLDEYISGGHHDIAVCAVEYLRRGRAA